MMFKVGDWVQCNYGCAVKGRITKIENVFASFFLESGTEISMPFKGLKLIEGEAQKILIKSYFGIKEA